MASYIQKEKRKRIQRNQDESQQVTRVPITPPKKCDYCKENTIISEDTGHNNNNISVFLPE